MHILDTPKIFERYDTRNLRGSIALLGAQCAAAWKESRRISIPHAYRRSIDQIVVAGMGGSALGAHIIASSFAAALRIPFSVVSGYALPRSITSRSVVLLSSYSGGTEETIAAAKEALSRRARMIGITTGGVLASFLRHHKKPLYQFDPVHNPCGQPRMGLGYSLFGQLGICTKLGAISLSADAVARAVQSVQLAERRYAPVIPKDRNAAKRLAVFLHQHVPILFGPDILLGSLHVFANQLNENAKTFSSFFALPELNHHLIEGLRFPRAARSLLRFVFFESSQAHARVQVRSRITETVVAKNGFSVWRQKVAGVTALDAALSLLVFGGYASFYVTLLEKIDPSAIPWVDYLKKQLANKK